MGLYNWCFIKISPALIKLITASIRKKKLGLFRLQIWSRLIKKGQVVDALSSIFYRYFGLKYWCLIRISATFNGFVTTSIRRRILGLSRLQIWSCLIKVKQTVVVLSSIFNFYK